MASKCSYYKENESDQVWWLDIPGDIGTIVFSFDKKKKYYLFCDYPDKLTVEQWMIFNAENPHWVDFFKPCNMEYIMKHTEEIEKYSPGWVKDNLHKFG